MEQKLFRAHCQPGGAFPPRPHREEPLLVMARRLEATQSKLLARLEQCLRDSAARLEKQQ